MIVLKIANFKNKSTNKKYCKTHSNDVVNINNKTNFTKYNIIIVKRVLIQILIIVKTINSNVIKIIVILEY